MGDPLWEFESKFPAELAEPDAWRNAPEPFIVVAFVPTPCAKRWLIGDMDDTRLWGCSINPSHLWIKVPPGVRQGYTLFVRRNKGKTHQCIIHLLQQFKPEGMVFRAAHTTIQHHSDKWGATRGIADGQWWRMFGNGSLFQTWMERFPKVDFHWEGAIR